MLYTRVTESRAKTLCAWWQIASPILARVLTAQHRCGFGVGCDHQEGLLALARGAVDTVDGPWPGGIGGHSCPAERAADQLLQIVRADGDSMAGG